MNTISAISFPKGTPEALITEALDSFPPFHRLLENNRLPEIKLSLLLAQFFSTKELNNFLLFNRLGYVGRINTLSFPSQYLPP
ncbi:hypothetical protein NG798_22650, partial [Ancylothrix sp. C2]|uniref:hypothetical protein n=1 Tax=Ancylothrix sp. D3o TaxID=2953691 RepID=UPI0021BA8C3A